MSFPRCECRAPTQCALSLTTLALAAALLAHQARAQAAHKPSEPQRKDIRDQLVSLDLRAKDPPNLPAETVVQRMMATSARRSAELKSVRAVRNYHLQYRGFLGSREAGMKVLSTYTSPDKLEFSVVSQNGSNLLLNRVLLKLLESERDAFKDEKQIELSPANYNFASEGVETADNDPCYVLKVTPRKETKYLYRGKVWIDARDFALARMEGQPAKSPSFWIKDTQIDSRWSDVGGFWLIQHSQSVSHIRMGGLATLTIDYSDYQITRSGGRHAHGQNPQLPDPASITPQR
jgi:hypothetical protein